MPPDEMINTDDGKITRSEWHHFFSVALPFQRTAEIRVEAFGGVTTVGLILGVLVAMRFLVAN